MATAATGNGAGYDDVDDSRARLVKTLATIIGAVYLLGGLAGFLVTGLDHFASRSHETLLGFEVNPLHNIVHILIGLAGLALGRKLAGARTYGWLLAVGYGVVFVLGLFVAGKNSSANFLSLNGADNVLHILSALAGLVIALLPVTRRTDTTVVR